MEMAQRKPNLIYKLFNNLYAQSSALRIYFKKNIQICKRECVMNIISNMYICLYTWVNDIYIYN